MHCSMAHSALTAVGVSIVAISALVGGCRETGNAKPPPASARVNAVPSSGSVQGVTVAEFCDSHATVADRKKFSFPPLASAAPSLGSGWSWINVWATWCEPCVEEIPRLVRWDRELSNIQLQLLSVDEDDETVQAFRGKHVDIPVSHRMAEPEDLRAWLTSYGLGEDARLPLHIFVDSERNVRCVRSGAVRKRDRVAIETLLRSN